MLDLDNTVAAYTEHSLDVDVAKWASDMKNNGIEMHIVSNSNRKWRVEKFARALGVGFINSARKPLPNSVLRLMRDMGFKGYESALVGDQVYTDAIAANLAKAVSLIVQPKRLSSPFLTLRYWIEAPFRALCRNKQWLIAGD